MTTNQLPPLPPEFRESLRALADLAQRAAHGTPFQQLYVETAETLDELAAAIATISATSQGPAPFTGRALEWREVIAESIRRRREESGLTQAQLAEAMQRVGFDWKRITVTEVESAVRRVGLEELLAIAGLFAVPMVLFLLPDKTDGVEVAGRTLDYETLSGALLGSRLAANPERQFPAGPGQPDLAAVVGVQILADADDWRPARELWRRRAERMLEPPGDGQ